MAKWWLFKCQNCGKKFREKFSREEERKVDIDRIGAKTHIVSTHHCQDSVYGCAKLIGARSITRKKVGTSETTT